MPNKPSLIGALAGLSLVATLGGAHAETYSLVAYLTGRAAVPPNDGSGFGQAQFTYDSDTRRLDYLVTYDGLSAAQVEIHGPADAGQNGPVLIPFPTPDSPVSGAIILSRGQGNELLEGKLYVDVHSQGYARGEIRGQIERQ
jgi:hypothetical protein